MAVEPHWVEGVGESRVLAADALHVYFGRRFSPFVGRVNLDGSDLKPEWLTLAGTEAEATALRSDGVHLYIAYQREDAGPTNVFPVARVKVDGTGMEAEWIPPGEEADGAIGAIALSATHIYLATKFSFLGRAKIDGTEVLRHWVTPTALTAFSAAVGATHVMVGSKTAGFFACLLDGSEPGFTTGPSAIGMCVHAGHMYAATETHLASFADEDPPVGAETVLYEGALEGLDTDGVGFLYWPDGEDSIGRLALPVEPTSGSGAYWSAEEFGEGEGPPPDPPPAGASYIEQLRERPPLRLNVSVETPTGQHHRLAWDAPDPGDVPMGLGLSNVMPGGYERCSFTLERDTRLSYPDLAELSKITVRGAGGVIAWQGRLEKTPDTGGFQEQVSPEAVGYQVALEDDGSAREVFIDQLLSSWAPAELQHKIELLEAGEDSEDAAVGAGAQQPTEASTPALITQLTGAWARHRISSAWYDAKGIPIGLLYYAWKEALSFEDANWEWLARLASDYSGAGPSVSTANLRGKGPGSGTLLATALSQALAEVKLVYPSGAGNDGQLYPVFWTVLAIIGAHGLPLYGTNSQVESKGVLCSDAVAYAIGRWAAELAFTTGPEGTIRPTSFIIDQLAFLDPTSVAEMVKQSARFELPDWAVWDGPTFYLNERGEGGRHWRARVGPAQLREAGPQVARLWNGVIVTYQDVTGRTRTVGPPGSGAELESEQLVDTDPENPLNEAGIKRVAPLSMGTSTAAGATKVGAIFLREQAQLDTSGEASIVGWVEDTSGVLSPAWAIRAGDTIAFVDASDSSARRIVHANYDEPTRACQLQLDQPPDSLTAILERLSASVAPLGF